MSEPLRMNDLWSGRPEKKDRVEEIPQGRRAGGSPRNRNNSRGATTAAKQAVPGSEEVSLAVQVLAIAYRSCSPLSRACSMTSSGHREHCTSPI